MGIFKDKYINIKSKDIVTSNKLHSASVKEKISTKGPSGQKVSSKTCTKKRRFHNGQAKQKIIWKLPWIFFSLSRSQMVRKQKERDATSGDKNVEKNIS